MTRLIVEMPLGNEAPATPHPIPPAMLAEAAQRLERLALGSGLERAGDIEWQTRQYGSVLVVTMPARPRRRITLKHRLK